VNVEYDEEEVDRWALLTGGAVGCEVCMYMLGQGYVSVEYDEEEVDRWVRGGGRRERRVQ
jgi:hypothetical protein